MKVLVFYDRNRLCRVVNRYAVSTVEIFSDSGSGYRLIVELSMWTGILSLACNFMVAWRLSVSTCEKASAYVRLGRN